MQPASKIKMFVISLQIRRFTQCFYSMQPCCHLGNLALSFSCHLGAICRAPRLFCWAILVFSGSPKCSSLMPPWCHLDHLAWSWSSHLGASSKCTYFFFWTILVLSGAFLSSHSLPWWSHHGHLALSLSSHLGDLCG